jgi:tetratricopeptide (TPR) repeat protein
MPRFPELLEEYGSWVDAVEALEADAETAPDDVQRAKAMHRMAFVLHEELGRSDRALEVLENLAEIAFDDTEAIDLLAALYRLRNKWDDLIGLQVDRLEVLAEGSPRALALLDAASAATLNKNDADTGAVLVTRAIMEDPASSEVLAALTALIGAVDDPTVLAEPIVSQLPAVADARGASATSGLHRLLALIFRKSDRLERAQVHLEQAAALEPDNEALTDQLLDLLEEMDDKDSIVDVLERKTTGAASTAMVPWLLRYARFVLPEEPARALVALQRARDVDPNNPAVSAALVGGFTAQERWTEAIDTLIGQSVWLNEQAPPDEVITLEDESDESADDDARAENDEGAAAEHRQGIIALLTHAARLRAEHLADDAPRNTSILKLRLAVDPTPDVATEAWNHAAAIADPGWARSIAETQLERVDAAEERAHWQIELGRLLVDAGEIESARELFRSASTSPESAQRAAAGGALLPLLPPETHLEERAQLLQALSELDEHESNYALFRIEASRLLEESDPAAAYASLLPLGTDADPATLGRMATLAQQLNRPDDAARWLQAQATSGDDAVGPLVEIARMQAGDGAAEYSAWEAVVAVSPRHTEALRQLVTLARERDDAPSQVLWLEALAQASSEPATRAEALAEAADVYRLQLDKPEQAWALYDQSLTLEPTLLAAAGPLAEKAIAEQNWARIPALVEVLLADPRLEHAPDIAVALRFNRALALEELAREPEAIAEYLAVVSLDPDHLEARRALAFLLLDSGQAAEADKHFAEAIDQDSTEDSTDLRVELFAGAAAAAQESGNSASALSRYRMALSLEPYHVKSLQGLVALKDDGDPDLTIQAYERLLALATDAPNRLRLLVELGDACSSADAHPSAVDAYRRAIEIEPDSKVVLHKLLQIFTTTEEWRSAAEVLGKLSTLETVPERRHKLLFAVAAIFRDQLEDFTQAASMFELILDDDPTKLEAFEAIDHMLLQAGLYKELERAYRKMLERTGAHPEPDSLRFMLLRNLGRLYANYLNDRLQAAASFDLALRIVPDHAQTWQQWIALYPTDGSADDTLVDIHRRALASAPELIDSYHALFSIWNRQRLWDRTLRVASVLDVMGQATDEEANFYRSLQPRALPLAPTPLTPELFALIQHPELDARITLLMRTLAATTASAFALDLNRWNVTRRDAINLEASHPITNLFVYTSQVIGTQLPQLLIANQQLGLFNANASPRSIIVGRDIYTGEANRRMVFRIAHAMTLLRDEFYIASAFGTRDWCKAMIYGTLATFTDTIIPDPSEEQVRHCHNFISRQSRPVLEQLHQVVNMLFADGASPDVSAWFRAVDLTAGRVGLLLCGDLSRSLQALRDTPESMSGMSVADRSRDLIEFSLTDAYEQVRASLRLGIGQQ